MDTSTTNVILYTWHEVVYSGREELPISLVPNTSPERQNLLDEFIDITSLHTPYARGKHTVTTIYVRRVAYLPTTKSISARMIPRR